MKTLTHAGVSVLLFWEAILCDRFYDFNVVLEVTIGNVVTVFCMVWIFKGIVIETFRRAFGETPG